MLGVCVLPKECAAVVLELKKRPNPRSPSFTSPVAVMNTLAGLISVYTHPNLLQTQNIIHYKYVHSNYKKYTKTVLQYKDIFSLLQDGNHLC